MPGPGFQLYGNPSGLQGLADSQRTYEARFQSILGQLAGIAGVTLGNWSGGGHDNFNSSHSKLKGDFEEVSNAFRKMAGTTDEAGGKWSTMIGYANSKF